MVWKSRRYRLLRWSAILLFASACYGGAAALLQIVGYAVMSYWVGAFIWGLRLLIGSASAILMGLIWWKASRMLTVVENASALQRPPSSQQDIPVAKPAPVGAAQRQTDTVLLVPAVPIDANLAPSVTPFRGRMSAPCWTLRRLGTAALVVNIFQACAALVESVFSWIRFGDFPEPLFRAGQTARPLGLAFQSIVFGLFIFAFTRLIARLGQAAEAGPVVDVARPIE